MSVAVEASCSVCSNGAQTAKSYRLLCSHMLCRVCLWEVSQETDTSRSSNFVHVECPQCKHRTPVHRKDLPAAEAPDMNEFCTALEDLSLDDDSNDEDDFCQFGSEVSYKSTTVPENSCVKQEPTVSSEKMATIEKLLATAESKFSNRIVKADSDKIAAACQTLERTMANKFAEIANKMRSSASQVYDEAEKLADKKIDYMRRSSSDLKGRCRAKAEVGAELRREINNMSFFNASNSDVAGLYKKAVKLNEEISNMSSLLVPFGSFKDSPTTEEFFANYCQRSFGTFDAKFARQTPLPVTAAQPPAMADEPPEPTPSPALSQCQMAVKEEPVAISPPPMIADVEKTPVRAQKESTPEKKAVTFSAVEGLKLAVPVKEPSVKTPEKVVYDGNLYSQMSMFAMVTSLSDDRRSLSRPVGVCAMRDATKRKAAVVHTGHKVTLFSAAANVIATYVLVDPDNYGRIQLVGDIAADTDGWLYVIDRDNLPSRVMAFRPERAKQKSKEVVPDVFARFQGRTRIYGLAVSSSNKMLYTSTRVQIHGLSTINGQLLFTLNMEDPPSAYVHSMFEASRPTSSHLSHVPFVVYTAYEGKGVFKKACMSNGHLESSAHRIASIYQKDQPISLVRRTACDPGGNVLGADSNNKEIRVFSSAGESIARFSPPSSRLDKFSASGVAVIEAHSNQSPSHFSNAEKCQKGMVHLGPVVVVTDFIGNRIFFFDVPHNSKP